jgi:hypothetical protein
MHSKHPQSIFCGSASAPSEVSVTAQVMALGLCVTVDALCVKYLASSVWEGLLFVVLAGAAGALIANAAKQIIEK